MLAGRAFQLIDDALDYYGKEEKLGKGGDQIRNKMAENLVNFRRFKEGYNL